MLRELKCDEGQGYFFSRPLAPAQIATLIPTWRVTMREMRKQMANLDAAALLRDTARHAEAERRPVPAMDEFSETLDLSRSRVSRIRP